MSIMNVCLLFKAVSINVRRKILYQHIRHNGGIIGNNTVVSDPKFTKIDLSRPYLLDIGDYCVISSGTTILTHDYSLSTIRRKYGEWIGEGGTIHIGNNCFIGMDSILLMGTSIGDNCVVGAGSVVKGKFPDNVVIAGNPARIICDLEEYYQKRKERTLHEASICVKTFIKRKGRNPLPHEMNGFKFLFCPRDDKAIKQYKLSFDCSADSPEEVYDSFMKTKPMFNDYDSFLDYCNNCD